MKNDIFISYRRDGGEYTAKIIRDRLTELGYRVFFDVETLRSGDFNVSLYSEIDECKDFVLILSPGALERCVNEDDWVRREVEYALSRGKNIIPIMLRGFTFPDTLPPALQPLIYKNGIEANTQFFDAFMGKLQRFLASKPGLFRKLWGNRVLRVLVPVLLVAVLALAAIAIGLAAPEPEDPLYPAATAEKDLTEEVIYHVGTTLTYYDILADAKADAISAAQRCIATGYAEISDLDDTFEVCLNTINTLTVEAAKPTEAFLSKLADSPFSSAEFTAMYDDLVLFRKSCIDDLAYIRQLAGPEFVLSDSDKLESISHYQVSLENELQVYAYAANLMLLPITDETALESFWSDILPELAHIPLRKANWNRDAQALEQGIDECINNMETAIADLSAILGKSTLAAAQEAEALISQYMELGYSREDAEQIVEYVRQGYNDGQAEYILVFTGIGYSPEQALDIYAYHQIEGFTLATAQALVDYENMDVAAETAEIIAYFTSQGISQATAEDYVASYLDLEESLYQARLKFCVRASDDEDTAWQKFLHLKDCMLYEEAAEALDQLYALRAPIDPYAEAYVQSAKLFLEQIESTGIDYGVLITGLSDQGHEVLQPGDIIIAFNGTLCRTARQYVDLKAALTGTDYTVTVLRGENGVLVQLELALTTDMPLVGISTLADS